jgi:hypothetical protein
VATIIEFFLHNLWIPIVLLGLFVWFRLRRSKQPAAAPERNTSDNLPNPEAVVEGMTVTRMLVSGHVKVVGPAGERIDDLPRSPFGEGEMPEAIWGVPGGPIFIVGKLYSGGDGADHGAIYRKDPGGTWQLVHIEEDATLHRVCGNGPDEVYAGAIGGVVYYDGHTFEFITTDYQMMNKCWRDGDELVLQAFDGSETHRLERDVLVPIEEREEPNEDRDTWIDADGTRYTVFDRMIEVGQDTLGADEAAQIRDELRQVDEILARRAQS